MQWLDQYSIFRTLKVTRKFKGTWDRFEPVLLIHVIVFKGGCILISFFFFFLTEILFHFKTPQNTNCLKHYLIILYPLCVFLLFSFSNNANRYTAHLIHSIDLSYRSLEWFLSCSTLRFREMQVSTKYWTLNRDSDTETSYLSGKFTRSSWAAGTTCMSMLVSGVNQEDIFFLVLSARGEDEQNPALWCFWWAQIILDMAASSLAVPLCCPWDRCCLPLKLNTLGGL